MEILFVYVIVFLPGNLCNAQISSLAAAKSGLLTSV